MGMDEFEKFSNEANDKAKNARELAKEGSQKAALEIKEFKAKFRGLENKTVRPAFSEMIKKSGHVGAIVEAKDLQKVKGVVEFDEIIGCDLNIGGVKFRVIIEGRPYEKKITMIVSLRSKKKTFELSGDVTKDALASHVLSAFKELSQDKK